MSVNAQTDLPCPEGMGHDMLITWGLWVRDDGDGRATWAVKQRIDPGHHGDLPPKVQFVDKLIARHRVDHHTDWSVISRYFLSDLPIWTIAKGLRWPTDRVNTVILRICGMVEREWRDSL